MVRNGHRQDLSPGDWLQSQCSKPTQNTSKTYSVVEVGVVVKEWVGKCRTTYKVRFILKKKIQVYTYVHRLAREGYMRNYSFLDFITFAYITHLEIKFTIKKTLGEKKKENAEIRL